MLSQARPNALKTPRPARFGDAVRIVAAVGADARGEDAAVRRRERGHVFGIEQPGDVETNGTEGSEVTKPEAGRHLEASRGWVPRIVADAAGVDEGDDAEVREQPIGADAQLARDEHG